MQVLDCAEQKIDGGHGLMYFDIALHYYATIKVEQNNKQLRKGLL